MEASLNEGALTLVNGKQPCLRIIYDLKAVLQKKKTDWHLELGLGALQVRDPRNNLVWLAASLIGSGAPIRSGFPPPPPGNLSPVSLGSPEVGDVPKPF